MKIIEALKTFEVPHMAKFICGNLYKVDDELASTLVKRELAEVKEPSKPTENVDKKTSESKEDDEEAETKSTSTKSKKSNK